MSIIETRLIGVLAASILSVYCGSAVSPTARTNETMGTTPTPRANAVSDRLTSSEGFRIPCLDKLKVKRPRSPLAKSETATSIYVTMYVPLNCTDDDGAIFQELVGGAKYDWKVSSVISYETEDRVFEYVVGFNARGTGALVELTYMDSTGTGKLDSVFQSGGMRKPVLPDWMIAREKTEGNESR